MDRSVPELKKSYRITHVFRQRWDWCLAGLALIWSGVFLLNAVITYIMPREYLGRGRLEFHPVKTEKDVPTEGKAPELIDKNEALVLTRDDVLYSVIDRLQLVRKLEEADTRQHAYLLLKEYVELRRFPDTSLVVSGAGGEAQR